MPQEPTAIERFADWKRRQRSALRTFVRGQISREYRAARTAASDRAQTAQRVRLNVSTFAQVPLLNAQQLVTSWRELLPDRRDSEIRRVPLEVKEPGVYVVEAVTGLLRAYTIAVVSDVGLVTKTSPGQIVMFAANRFTGEPAAGCEVRVLAAQQPIAPRHDDAPMARSRPRCRRPAATRSWGWRDAATRSPSPTRAATVCSAADARAGRLRVHRQADLPPRPHRAHQGGAALARARRPAPFDGREVELTVSDVNDKVIFRRRLTVDRFGAVEATVPVPASAALGRYTIKVTSGDREATGGFEVQEYRRPEFEVIATPAARFVVQGREAVVTVQARYYFGQPVANGQLRWVVNEQFYSSPLRWNDEAGDEGGGYFYGGDQTQRGHGAARRQRPRRAPHPAAAAHRRGHQRLQRPHRGAGHRRERPPGVRLDHRPRHARHLPALGTHQRLRARGRRAACTATVDALDYSRRPAARRCRSRSR